MTGFSASELADGQAMGKFRFASASSRAGDGLRASAAGRAPASTRTVGTLSPQQTPPNVNWSGLSPEGRERLGRIGMRLSAGYSNAEIATMVEVVRDQIEHLALPRRGLPVTSNWVAKELRDLRDELVDVS